MHFSFERNPKLEIVFLIDYARFMFGQANQLYIYKYMFKETKI